MSHPANARGIVMMLLAMGLLSLMDAGLKQLALHYPPLQVTALRSLASWPVVAAWVLWRVGARPLLRVHWRLQALRGALGVVTLAAFVAGVKHLPLTTAYTLFFVAPLIITALSALVLRERIGGYRWLAIGAGFAGVLVALRPTGEGVLTWAGLCVLGAALGYAASAITVRVLGRTDSSETIIFWTLSMMAPVAAALAAPQWIAVASGHWLLIAGVGVVGAFGQYALTEAFARGEASVIAPFEYTALAWGLGLDLVLWGVLPGGSTAIGAAIIVASGVYLLRRERGGQPEAQVQP